MARIKNVDKTENTDEKIKWENRKNGLSAIVKKTKDGKAYIHFEGSKVEVSSKSRAYYIASDFMKETAEIGT